MKSLKQLSSLILIVLLSTTCLEAQITPDVDFKGLGLKQTGLSFNNPIDLAGVKTDPVLKNPKELAGIKTDPVLKTPTDLAGIKPDPILTPVLEMIAMFEKLGATVEARLNESAGLTVLELKVNGEQIEPIIIQCKDCVIVYEY